jgi:hypothetical protein
MLISSGKYKKMKKKVHKQCCSAMLHDKQTQCFLSLCRGRGRQKRFCELS